jgi:hypothetical protein
MGTVDVSVACEGLGSSVVQRVLLLYIPDRVVPADQRRMK